MEATLSKEQQQATQQPRVGIGILVLHEGKLLISKRLSPHGESTYAPPGGHLEFNETPAECAIRELEEETGLKAETVVEGLWTNDQYKDRHYVTLFMIVTKFSGELTNNEPHKHEDWEWHPYLNLPAPLFLSMQNLVKKPEYFKLMARHSGVKEIAYLASPYAHKDPVVKKSRLTRATELAADLLDQGIFVFSPLTHNVDIDIMTKGSGWDKWRPFDISMLSHCDKLILLKQPGWENSVGVKDELEFARAHDIPIEEIEC